VRNKRWGSQTERRIGETTAPAGEQRRRPAWVPAEGGEALRIARCNPYHQARPLPHFKIAIGEQLPCPLDRSLIGSAAYDLRRPRDVPFRSEGIDSIIRHDATPGFGHYGLGNLTIN
jgi:hypothetical protein